MPIDIHVGPSVLTINNGGTFMVTALDGGVATESEQGLFAGDTRFLSYYACFVDGLPWTLVTSSPTQYYAAQLYFMNPAISTANGLIPERALSLVISRSVREGIHEDLDLTNHSLAPVRFMLEVAVRSDFADIFEVRSHRFERRGRIVTTWNDATQELYTTYHNNDFRRACGFRVHDATSSAHYANGRIAFEIELAPGQRWHTCCLYTLIEGVREHQPPVECYHPTIDIDPMQQAWWKQVTRLTSTNEDVYQLFQQSLEDLCALRMRDDTLDPDTWVPAAGVPWFVALFGRDSLIVSLQAMPIFTGFARGTLQKLAHYQATERDDWRDAQPGKILHEIRFGEWAHIKKIPHTPYYGTADATPLYLVLLHETWKWTGDTALLQTYRDTALRCLEWIDNYGDADGDGFQEYQTRSPVGYENMVWKDAGDSVVYHDGSQVKAPKAVCELQGYVFDAWLRMAELFDAFGEAERASALRTKAAQLAERFDTHFWCEEIGCYAYALDANKQQVKTVVSDAGHLLWSGIVQPKRAGRVVQRLMEQDMWSGLGIRTLSSHNPAYNPYSYHCGSIWPHDNGIIALGFKRYGFASEAARVARGISEAASYFASHRLPELYAGTPWQPGLFPVQYLGANVPQAWAAGSAFHLIQALLGLRADAPHGQLLVDPQLPRWLPDLTLQNIAVGDAIVDLRFWREAEKTRWDAVVRAGNVEVVEQAWQSWLR